MFESLTLEQKKAIAVVCAAVLLLDDEKERPNKPRVGQEVLPRDPKTESTWATIWANGDDRTLVKLINLDRPAFEKILPSFESEFRLRDTAGDLLVTKKNKTSSRLQNRKISADGCLGITLMWLSSTCETKYLGVIFGVNEHLAWKYIRLGCGLLFLVSSEKSQRVCLKSTHTSPDPTTRCDLPLGCLS